MLTVFSLFFLFFLDFYFHFRSAFQRGPSLVVLFNSQVDDVLNLYCVVVFLLSFMFGFPFIRYCMKSLTKIRLIDMHESSFGSDICIQCNFIMRWTMIKTSLCQNSFFICVKFCFFFRFCAHILFRLFALSVYVNIQLAIIVRPR